MYMFFLSCRIVMMISARISSIFMVGFINLYGTNVMQAKIEPRLDTS